MVEERRHRQQTGRVQEFEPGKSAAALLAHLGS